MKKWERNTRKEEHKIPSFSSTLLDQIYRSIDDGETNSGDSKFYREPTPAKKQSRTRALEDDETASLQRTCLIEKWMEKKVGERVDIYRRQELYKIRSQPDSDHDRDTLFFSSTSLSSDSSSGGFSSSDTESMFGARSLTPACFAPARPKPIRTSVAAGKAEKKQSGFHYKAVSPGARLAGFLNSLFTANNTKKTRNSSETERKSKAGEESSCSSASSFARSCLSKHSALAREKQGVKRTVRFCPESIISSENCRPTSHKCLFEEQGSSSMAVSIPTAWKIGGLKSAGKTEEKDAKFQVKEKSRKVEEAAREFMMKKNLKNRELMQNYRNLGEEDDDDDASSCSSSDLFELDHLEMIGRRRYDQELPVYETTRVEKNRAIAKSLQMQS